MYFLSFDTEFDCVVTQVDRCCVLQVSLAVWEPVPPSNERDAPGRAAVMRDVIAVAIDTILIPSAAVREFLLAHFTRSASPSWIKLCHAPSNDLAIFERDFGVPACVIGPIVDTCLAEVLLRRRIALLDASQEEQGLVEGIGSIRPVVGIKPVYGRRRSPPRWSVAKPGT